MIQRLHRYLLCLSIALLSFAGLPASAAPGAVEAVTLTPFAGGNNESRRALVQPDGKMILVGTARFGTMQFSATRYTAEGTLDATFGTGGTIIEPVGPGDSEAWAGALQADGKLVMAGWSQPSLGPRRFAIARFNADGSFDTSFGGGAVTTMFGSFDSEARAVVVQPDGKIVAGGFAIANSRRVFALARYNADGSLDASFGSGGLLTRAPAAVDQIVHALALQPDDKIVAAGDSGTDHVIVVRFNANGTADPAWTGGGVLYFSNVRDIAIRGFDGKVYVVGTTVTGMVTGAPLKAGVGRFLPDGSVDNGYGASGVVEIDTGTASYGFGLVLQPDFKVAVSGGVEISPGHGGVLMARLESSGAVDTTFGTGGKTTVTVSANDFGYGLARRPDGRFIVAGRATGQAWDSLAVAFTAAGQLDATFNASESPGYDVLEVGSNRASAFASVLQPDGKLLVAGMITNESAPGSGFAVAVVARYLPDHTLDTTFGSGGQVFYNGAATSIALAGDGKIVTAGYSYTVINGATTTVTSFARLLPNGTFDTTFGTNGVSFIPGNGTGLENIHGIAVQPDGRIVAGGSSEVGAFSDIKAFFMRLTVSGQLDPTFSDDGRARIPLTSGRNWINAVALQADGKILAAGYSEPGSSGTSPPSFTLARINADGSLDTSFGSGGLTRTVIDGTTSEAMAMARQPDGRIVLAGRSFASPTRNFALARYLPDGTLDTSFGTGGTVTSDFGNHDDAYAVALLANGQIVAAGQSGGQFAVARYSASGAPDPAFGTGGVTIFAINAGSDIARAVTVGLDGKLHVSGSASGVLAVARLSNELSTSGPGDLSVSPTTLDFGGQSMGTTSPPHAVVVTNSGGTPATIDGVTVSGPFAQTNDCGTLAPAQSCTVNVTFSPPASGGALNSTVATHGTLAISHGGNITSVPLSGAAEKSLVSHYYRAILRRAPDAGGKGFWQDESARLASLGADVNEAWYAMAMAFFNSGEYAALSRGDEGFLTDVYTTFFNRAPDASGMSYWRGQLSGGLPREVVLVTFMMSPEFRAFTQAIFGNTQARPEVDLVMDFYRGLFARLPDSGGFGYWVQRFRAAQCHGGGAVNAESDAASAGFLHSQEYVARMRSNAQFVGDMYNGILRRGGDLQGVRFWIDELDAGRRSREDVRRAFGASPEYQGRVQAIVDAGCMQ